MQGISRQVINLLACRFRAWGGIAASLKYAFRQVDVIAYLISRVIKRLECGVGAPSNPPPRDCNLLLNKRANQRAGIALP